MHAAGDPQVVSMNGVLASEACNAALDLVTAYSGGRRGGKMWQYEGRAGQLEQHDLPSRRSGCAGCAQEGHGDPVPIRPLDDEVGTGLGLVVTFGLRPAQAA